MLEGFFVFSLNRVIVLDLPSFQLLFLIYAGIQLSSIDLEKKISI
jgi:hypothetical protein